MKSKLIGIIGWVVAIGFTIGVLGLAIFIVFALLSEDEVVKENDSQEETTVEVDTEVSEEDIQEEVQEVDTDNIQSESNFRDTLHHMTHQKVHAQDKWGAVEITDERIDLMLETVKESNFTHQDFYIEALTAWQNGDFSNAVEVHNYIWELKKGNVGRALRLFSEEEEQQYKEKYFR
ncbi:hypothetical protein SAMN04487943_102283 [Gracilibacillus orientalis]|uniref:Uncharacterized protein n=1 Tax=Gracilibacillus orientalis TaxID=334253 RepID=A0A1I4IT04_9BACI|nr:DUF6241 domain-containing protein [Gracilibacillus orientalis]SFL57482.1 hypothetical protein SAMN04487943_102283 [Gracilibacillus orientalis]